MSKRQIPSSQRPEPQPFSRGLSTRALCLWSRSVAFARCRENALLAARVLPASRLEGLASAVGYDGVEGLAAATQELPGF